MYWSFHHAQHGVKIDIFHNRYGIRLKYFIKIMKTKSNLRNYYGILFYLIYRNQKFYRNSHYSKNNLMFGTHQELQ